METVDLKEKLKEIEASIKTCETRIMEIESSFKSRLFSKKELKALKDELLKLENQRSESLGMYDDIITQNKLARKKDTCQELLDEVSTLDTIHDVEGKAFSLTDELKESFIDEINAFQESDKLFSTYSYEKTSDYSIREEFCLNRKGNIGIRITINDLGIDAKSHKYIDTVDEMLYRYSEYLEKSNSNSHKKTI